MSGKIPVFLTKQQIDYIMSHAHNMELKALDANRAVSHQFYVELGQALFDAEAANKYEQGAA